MKALWKNEKFWAAIGYTTLILCVIGQITVGYFYLLAQFGYLLANGLGVVRDFALNLPNANKVRDIVFTGITIGLIIIRFCK